MRKIIYSFAVILLLSFAFINRTEIVKALGNMIRSGADVPTGTLSLRTSNATTSPAYVQNGAATSTLTFYSENFSSVTLNVQAFASSTNVRSPFQFTVQGSDELTDWFAQDNTVQNATLYQGSSGSVPLASSTIPFTWLPATSGATTTKQFNIKLLPSRYTRILIDLASTSPGTGGVAARDGGNVWVNIVGNIQQIY